MQEARKGCKKNNIRAEEEQITAARAKHMTRANYSNRHPPGPTTQTIPITRQHPKTIVWTIPISKVSDINCPDNSNQ